MSGTNVNLLIFFNLKKSQKIQIKKNMLKNFSFKNRKNQR